MSPSQGMDAASIVIPAWNGINWIADCLRSIEPQLRPGDEIIVVDNGSSDGTPDLVARGFPRARLIRLDRNLGFAGGVNRGLDAARGDILILVNQDVTLREGCLGALRRRLEEGGPAIVGCKLLYPDGKTVQHAGGVIRWPRGEPDHRGYRQIDDGRWDEPEPVDYVTGAVLALDRSVLRAVGRFDEGFYPAYYEEVDYCFRARAAGFAVLVEPRAVAIHHESQSTGIGSQVYLQAMHRGRLRFVFKHRTAEQFCDEFAAAERDWLAISSRIERSAVAQAYLHTLLNVPWLTAPGVPESSTRIIETLAALRQQAIQPEEISMSDIGQAEPKPVLQEHVFRSEVPVVGGLIAWFRSAWHGIAGKWAIRAIIEPQNRFNAEVDQRLIDTDRDLVALARNVAEINVKLSLLTRSIESKSDAANGQGS